MPRIEIAGVSRRFGTGHAALDGLHLIISIHELLTVVGPSGSGKSTLLRLVAGLDKPDSGTITIDGRDAGALGPQERDAALVFQNQAPFPYLNGRENLAFGAKARHVPLAEVRDRVDSIADFLGLEDCLGRMPATMSGGEKQRLALGRALVRRPSLLLLDEPFSNLDTPLRVYLRAKLAEAHRRFGMTTVLVTHDQEEALAMGDRVAVLNEGRLEQLGRGRDLYDRPANRFVAGFIGNPPMGCLPVDLELRGEAVVLVFPHGGKVEVDSPACAAVLRASGRSSLHLGLRPEHLHLVQDGSLSSGPELSMRVLSVEDRGLDRIARLGRPPEEFWIRLPPGHEPGLDDAVQVHMDLEKASWFDQRNGSRLS
ncbi:MAG: ATPase component of ABC-type sugar transporter [Planctomycetota bacterium]|nr:ATPase component of ABC-type sugar transporter [Planctomycetota bacterium]